LWQIPTARTGRRSNQSGEAVDGRETGSHELGQEARDARLESSEATPLCDTLDDKR
jgi:hypothetical protein